MSSRSEIAAEINRMKQLPQTPARLRQIQALERCIGMELRPDGKTKRKRAEGSGPRVVRRVSKSFVSDDDDDIDEEKERKPRKSDFNAANFLGDLLGTHHSGMS